MGHGDALQIEDDGSAEDLGPRLQNAELENNDGRLEDLLDGILPRIPIPQTVYHYPSSALGPVRRHGNNVVVSDVLHLERPYILVDLRMLLFEVAVIHDLSKDLLRRGARFLPRVDKDRSNVIFTRFHDSRVSLSLGVIKGTNSSPISIHTRNSCCEDLYGVKGGTFSW